MAARCRRLGLSPVFLTDHETIEGAVPLWRHDPWTVVVGEEVMTSEGELIGLFLKHAAESGYQQVLIREALQGEPVRRFMNPEPVVVPPSLDLRHWVDDYVYRYHRKLFPVASNGHLEGVISTQALAQIPREEWPLHTIAEVMRHDLGPASISPDADALDALSRMQRTGMSRLLVTDGDRLVGIVSLKDLLRFLNQKIELEGLAE